MAINVDKALVPSDILVEDGPEVDIDPLTGDADDPDYELMGEEQNEDGSVVIDFDPNGEDEDRSEDHNVNLAELLEDEALSALSAELVQAFKDDKDTRAPWEKAYTSGIALLGLNIESRQQPWAGASGVFHPILTEAVVKFQAEAMMETFPASGPVLTRIIGKTDRDRERQAKRVRGLY